MTRTRKPGVAVLVGVLWCATLMGASAPHLSSRHTGWRKTNCSECHDTATLASVHAPSRMIGASRQTAAGSPVVAAVPTKPSQCGPCHGYNGAPHEGHAVAINPCGMCHSRVAHASAFEAPADCIGCHVHPKSPQGR